MAKKFNAKESKKLQNKTLSSLKTEISNTLDVLKKDKDAGAWALLDLTMALNNYFNGQENLSSPPNIELAKKLIPYFDCKPESIVATHIPEDSEKFNIQLIQLVLYTFRILDGSPHAPDRSSATNILYNYYPVAAKLKHKILTPDYLMLSLSVAKLKHCDSPGAKSIKKNESLIKSVFKKEYFKTDQALNQHVASAYLYRAMAFFDKRRDADIPSLNEAIDNIKKYFELNPKQSKQSRTTDYLVLEAYILLSSNFSRINTPYQSDEYRSKFQKPLNTLKKLLMNNLDYLSSVVSGDLIQPIAASCGGENDRMFDMLREKTHQILVLNKVLTDLSIKTDASIQNLAIAEGELSEKFFKEKIKMLRKNSLLLKTITLNYKAALKLATVAAKNTRLKTDTTSSQLENLQTRINQTNVALKYNDTLLMQTEKNSRDIKSLKILHDEKFKSAFEKARATSQELIKEEDADNIKAEKQRKKLADKLKQEMLKNQKKLDKEYRVQTNKRKIAERSSASQPIAQIRSKPTSAIEARFNTSIKEGLGSRSSPIKAFSTAISELNSGLKAAQDQKDLYWQSRHQSALADFHSLISKRYMKKREYSSCLKHLVLAKKTLEDTIGLLESLKDKGKAIIPNKNEVILVLPVLKKQYSTFITTIKSLKRRCRLEIDKNIEIIAAEKEKRNAIRDAIIEEQGRDAWYKPGRRRQLSPHAIKLIDLRSKWLPQLENAFKCLSSLEQTIAPLSELELPSEEISLENIIVQATACKGTAKNIYLQHFEPCMNKAIQQLTVETTSNKVNAILDALKKILEFSKTSSNGLHLDILSNTLAAFSKSKVVTLDHYKKLFDIINGYITKRCARGLTINHEKFKQAISHYFQLEPRDSSDLAKFLTLVKSCDLSFSCSSNVLTPKHFDTCLTRIFNSEDLSNESLILVLEYLHKMLDKKSSASIIKKYSAKLNNLYDTQCAILEEDDKSFKKLDWLYVLLNIRTVSTPKPMTRKERRKERRKARRQLKYAALKPSLRLKSDTATKSEEPTPKTDFFKKKRDLGEQKPDDAPSVIVTIPKGKSWADAAGA